MSKADWDRARKASLEGKTSRENLEDRIKKGEAIRRVGGAVPEVGGPVRGGVACHRLGRGEGEVHPPSGERGSKGEEQGGGAFAGTPGCDAEQLPSLGPPRLGRRQPEGDRGMAKGPSL